MQNEAAHTEKCRLVLHHTKSFSSIPEVSGKEVSIFAETKLLTINIEKNIKILCGCLHYSISDLKSKENYYFPNAAARLKLNFFLF